MCVLTVNSKLSMPSVKGVEAPISGQWLWGLLKLKAPRKGSWLSIHQLVANQELRDWRQKWEQVFTYIIGFSSKRVRPTPWCMKSSESKISRYYKASNDSVSFIQKTRIGTTNWDIHEICTCRVITCSRFSIKCKRMVYIYLYLEIWAP